MQEEIQEEKSMDTTVTIEFTSNMEQHLRILEQQLKHIRDVKVDVVEARDHKAPSLFAIAIGKSGERAEKAAETGLPSILRRHSTIQNSRSEKAKAAD